MRHRESYIRGKYAVFGFFWCLFQFLWFQKTLRRSNVIVRGPLPPEISTEHFGVLNINSWKNDVLLLPTICGHFFDFWWSQNTIFGQKIWKICGCRNFWRSLKCFLRGPRIWKYFRKIYSLSIKKQQNIRNIHHINTKEIFFHFEEQKNAKIDVIFVYKTTVLFFSMLPKQQCCFFSSGTLMDSQDVPKKKSKGFLQYSRSSDPIFIK